MLNKYIKKSERKKKKPDEIEEKNVSKYSTKKLVKGKLRTKERYLEYFLTINYTVSGSKVFVFFFTLRPFFQLLLLANTNNLASEKKWLYEIPMKKISDLSNNSAGI